ncbi:helix-loop-helix DNA-binding domain-containing protein [Mycena olivaceomarginata]|nr:helix-loop-helix DNA-binding domain-containing protein [Mycena olivaceomarginata]
MSFRHRPDTPERGGDENPAGTWRELNQGNQTLNIFDLSVRRFAQHHNIEWGNEENLTEPANAVSAYNSITTDSWFGDNCGYPTLPPFPTASISSRPMSAGWVHRGFGEIVEIRDVKLDGTSQGVESSNDENTLPGVGSERGTGAETGFGPVDEKRRRRRESHNAVERRRRDNINLQISELAKLIPQYLFETDADGDKGISREKGVILQKTLEYIRSLEQLATVQAVRRGELEERFRATRSAPVQDSP